MSLRRIMYSHGFLCVMFFSSFWTAMVHALPAERLKPKYLSEWKLFEIGKSNISLSKGIHPYTIKTPLFTDYARKWRAFKLPKNKNIKVDDDGRLHFPEQTIIVKTFYYPRASIRSQRVSLASEGAERYWLTSIDTSDFKPIETRILLLKDGVWLPFVYLWDQDASRARLIQGGQHIPLSVKGAPGVTHFDYAIPSRPQCSECHGGFDAMGRTQPLGFEYVQVDINVSVDSRTISQVYSWEQQGLISPPPLKLKASSLPREYLHINCAHCHSRYGTANSSRLMLDRDQAAGSRIGICKPPIAAGRGALGMHYDIVPGFPQKSILLLRMQSTQTDIRMPEVGRSLVDDKGVLLISEWIQGLQASERNCH